jgi:inositol-phosphate phosphatase / L-galactose 1-phosphate phosphatase / histidinol-phosphatase
MALAKAVAERKIIWGGDCYNYGLLASGHIDVVCEAGLKLHDFAALVPVVEGAGGTMCDWNGEPLHATSTGEVLALGDPARLEDVLDAMH